MPSHRPGGAPRSAPPIAARAQDHIFPAYREHVVGRIRGLDPMRIIEMLRGLSHGGWVPAETGNFHLYTLVIGSQTLHATGYAMGDPVRRRDGTGDPETDAAVLVYFGDGAIEPGRRQRGVRLRGELPDPAGVLPAEQPLGDLGARRAAVAHPALPAGGPASASRACRSTATTCSRATRSPGRASTTARAGEGPRFIEALTYRMGAHTTSDDPTKYRDAEDLQFWADRDPIARFEAYLRDTGAGDDFFHEVAVEAEDLAADVRRRTLELGVPTTDKVFDNVYSDPHPLVDAQRRWLDDYEADVRGGGCRVSVEMTMAKAINAGLRARSPTTTKVLLMGEDIGTLGGVFRVTEGLKAEFGEKRVLDTPLAESGIVGTAIGLAMRGYRPVCEIQFDGLHLPRLRPDHLAAREAHLPPRGVAVVPGRHPGALRRPHRRRRAPPGEPGGVLRAHGGPARGQPGDAARRLLDDPGGDPQQRPGDVLRAEEPLLAEGRGRPRRRPDLDCTRAASCGRQPR